MTTPGDLALLSQATACIVLAVLLITRLRVHPFLGLMCAAVVLAIIASPDASSGLASIEKGFGSVLGGVGPVIALGLTLGAILSLSGAASVLAARFVSGLRESQQAWGVLFAALVIGLPLFFETGVVVLLPVVAAIACTGAPGGVPSSRRRLLLALPALAGLSALHALVPPHPGPLAAVHELGASVGRTLVYGVLVGIPAAAIAGPLFARVAANWVDSQPADAPRASGGQSPSLAASLLVVVLPVALISGAELARAWAPGGWVLAALTVLGTPSVALLATNLVGLAILLPRRRVAPDELWNGALAPAASILLSIGAGGALKQVLVDVGLAPTLLHLLDGRLSSPILLGWTIAATVRLATGSATVATVTAAGLMAAMPGGSAAHAEWIVLAIGAGSIFFSYVNDPGFWLVKGFLGTTTGGTVATWSVLETLMSVTALAAILIASRFLP